MLRMRSKGGDEGDCWRRLMELAVGSGVGVLEASWEGSC